MAPAPKSVAVVGAGPAGLATAKYLLAAGLRPVVFEPKSHVGGLWAPPSASDAIDTIQLDPRMTVNTSKYTSFFSDYFPESVAALPDRPVAREMGEYLKGYAATFIPPELLRLETLVTGVEKRVEGGWKVRFKGIASNKMENEEDFEFLVLATGVFSHTYTPKIAAADSFEGKMLHVSDYDGEKLFSGKKKPRKVVVVGGELSGSEAAADVALRVSSLPEEEREKIEVIQVFPRPPWVLPKLGAIPDPQVQGAPKLLAIDQGFYDTPSIVNSPPAKDPKEKYRRLHKTLIGIKGGDQSDISPALGVSPEWRDKPLSLGLSDSYIGFAKSGAIKTILGRVVGVKGQRGLEIVTVKEGEESRALEDVDLVIWATGYTPLRTLSRILSPGLKTAFGADENSCPAVLTRALYKQTLHPALGPTGAFVGIQRRPYFAMFELQARWIAGLFTGKIIFPSLNDFEDVAKGEAHLLAIGKIDEVMIHAGGGGDYIEFLRQIGKIIGIDDVFKYGLEMNCRPRPWIPAHLPPFPDAGSPRSQHSLAAQSALENQINSESTSPSLISRHIFAQLHGHWTINRHIVSRLPGFPSGIFTGTAIFQPRLSTFSSPLLAGQSCTTGHTVLPPDTNRYTMGNEITEYLYSETGTLTTETGFSFQGSRKYIYTLDPDKGIMSTWFVKPADGVSVDYFFHRIEIGRKPEKLENEWGCRWGVEKEGGVKAASEHLCERDWYWPGYRFEYEGPRLKRFWIRYRVQGPQKEYVTEAEYTRG
ncbi:FAD/NAD(P)-binding domain-containing protein [Ascodesmis nigricans]|uniref:FAD/NAD(P)-binding domain-containing protein n=1 Tax=Ascodesmis nigricans TaxID=341454 RepID=A0A4S2MS28_9PEZI|nr:FAD/NAD(P)-binding domain-containing protein [Ascodesmis nigricans]